MITNDLSASERRFCTGSRAIEWVLVSMALWASLVMAWTPTVLRDNPPPFYKVINNFADAWAVGFIIGIIAVVHLAGLLISRGALCGRVDDDCRDCAREKLSVRLRYWGAKGQAGTWFFLTVIYVLLFAQRGQVTFGSGACAILTVCASLTSYCVAKERARMKVRGEVNQVISDVRASKTDRLQRLGDLAE